MELCQIRCVAIVSSDRAGMARATAEIETIGAIGVALALLGKRLPQGRASIADQNDGPDPGGRRVCGCWVEGAAHEEVDRGQEIF